MSHIAILAFVSIVAVIASWKLVDAILYILRRRTHELKRQAELIDRYYDLAARVLRNTDDENHHSLRMMMVTIPELIQNGNLAKVFFVRNGRKSPKKTSANKEIHNEMARLPEGLTATMGEAFFVALVASTFSLSVFGGPIRVWLFNLFGDDQRSVPDPEQVATRLGSFSTPRGQKTLAMA